jgi:hypothetical protein
MERPDEEFSMSAQRKHRGKKPIALLCSPRHV